MAGSCVLLLQKREWGPALEEDDPSWLRVGKLTDFKVRWLRLSSENTAIKIGHFC